MKGLLGEGVLPGVLRELYVGRRTGLMHFSRGQDRASVCFIRGHIVWGNNTDPETHLGPVLVRHGLVAQEVIDQAYDLVGGGRRLGEVLLELGGLDRATLDEALALHVRELLLTVFSWQEGSFHFEEHPAERFSGHDRALPLSTGELVLDAAWSVTDPDVVRHALGGLDRVPQLTTDPLLRFQRLSLTPTDGYLLSRIDGILTAREVLALVSVDREEAERSLFGLLCTGMVEWVERAEPARREAPRADVPSRDEVLAAYRDLGARDHFAVLGLDRSASETEIRSAWVRLAKRFHPDVHHHPALAELRVEIEAIFSRLAEASRVLSDPQRRAEYESLLVVEAIRPQPGEEAPSAEPPPAEASPPEESLAAAEQAYEQGRYWDALQALEPFQGEGSGRIVQRGRLLRAKVLLKNPKWRKDAEQELLSLIKADPANAEAHFLLGTLYKREGVAARATAMFRKVLSLKPRHAGALAELGGSPRAEGPGGLLKKLLR
jgi:curved DNA-binding protein CbpA